MKKIITAIAFAVATTTTTFAADYLNVVSVVYNNNNSTTVLFERTNVNNNHEEKMMSLSNTYKGKLSVQEAVNRGSLIASDYITVRSSLASTTPKQGQVNKLAQARSDAWQKDGLAGYFAELTRQIQAEGLLW